MTWLAKPYLTYNRHFPVSGNLSCRNSILCMFSLYSWSLRLAQACRESMTNWNIFTFDAYGKHKLHTTNKCGSCLWALCSSPRINATSSLMWLQLLPSASPFFLSGYRRLNNGLPSSNNTSPSHAHTHIISEVHCYSSDFTKRGISAKRFICMRPWDQQTQWTANHMQNREMSEGLTHTNMKTNRNHHSHYGNDY